MQVLEKILREIEERINDMTSEARECEEMEEYTEAEVIDQTINGLNIASNIIRSHMGDEPVSDTYKLDNGWIPVEERLPEPGVYLVSCDDKEYPVKRMRMKGICFCDHNGIYDGKVYAWQPLPAPYRPKQ
ncbi:MAG: DUF551 domain-containing protein [Eubacteriales bacterium]|nr:DUF551 domain-containing protein [Eubacteriales bacterium]